MRIVITCLLLVWSLSIYSQIDLDIKTINAIEHKIAAIDSIQINSDSDSLITEIPDIKAKHWNTNVYNPYKEVEVEYPIQLNFKDTS